MVISCLFDDLKLGFWLEVNNLVPCAFICLVYGTLILLKSCLALACELKSRQGSYGFKLD